MTAPDTVTVVIADDDEDVRTALRLLLDDAPDIEVVAEASDAAATVAATEEHDPDVAVVDVRMPGGGLSAVKRITALPGATKVVVLTAEDEPDVRGDAFTNGAVRFITKSDGDDLVSAIRDAAGR